MAFTRSGWKRSTFDARDEVAPPAAGQAPRGSLLLPTPFAARDQGDDVPCCVAMAVVGAMEVLDALRPPAAQLSPLFLYYAARPDPRSLGELELRDGLKAAVRDGVCRLDLHDPPLSRDGALRRPSAAAWDNAREHRAVGWDATARRLRYRELRDPDRALQWRATLAAQRPVLIGIFITDAYERLRSQPTHGPVDGLRSTFGHAALVTGYSEERDAFRVRDSRGPAFADQGSWWLPAALASTSLVAESWVLDKIAYDV